jgi:hypothetical protein
MLSNMIISSTEHFETTEDCYTIVESLASFLQYKIQSDILIS